MAIGAALTLALSLRERGPERTPFHVEITPRTSQLPDTLYLALLC
jgi:hypothetical protein